MLAERQTAGRGRRGRSWFSPFAGSLYLTVGWTYAQGLAVLEGLSLMVGLTLVQALEGRGVTGLSLKWPNDVLWQGKKLAGVLVDVQGDPMGETQVAVGIGLNVRLSAGDDHIGQPWVDLHAIMAAMNISLPSRNALAASVLNELIPALALLEQKGFSVYREQWQAHDAYNGLDVAAEVGGEWIVGKARGINAQGAYQIDTESGRRIINGGDISLRSVVADS